MSRSTAIPQPIVELARSVETLIREQLGSSTRVFLFGSWVAGNADDRSDIDIAFLPKTPPTPQLEFLLRDRIDELPTLRGIDLVDLSSADSEWRECVMREGMEL